MNTKVVIFCDGGARGNPGPAGIGVIAKIANQDKKEISKFIGTATNNQAEYRAVIEALKWLTMFIHPNRFDPTSDVGINRSDDYEIECFLDSQLIVEQLNQRYKLKNEGLKPLFWEVRDLVMTLGGKISFKYIPREQNKIADKLVNKAIDEASK